MKVLAACLLLALGVSAQQADNIIVPETATRVLKADVLRDAPGVCFGSTTCAFYEPGMEWNLVVFCGQATCMKNETGLFEIVKDCGPQPKANPQCEQILSPPNSVFPDCCPRYNCQPGATLEFPTEEEIKAQLEALRKSREEAAAAAEANAQA
ncbi:hypothetical protein E2C01_077452 [Portunus trituberculatus]|uniref:Single domain-containing protein n=1 Tax=Portunus trituberculatus TaxID=210409 RepID=A0A5B7IEH4_PORTR|nr:hypothetical protein [Portunus trituberculatus]